MAIKTQPGQPSDGGQLPDFGSRILDIYTGAALYYSLSTLHCLTVSLAEDGAGLGAMWGEQTARRMLMAAGFAEIEVAESPRPQNAIFICRKDGTRNVARG